MWEGGKRRGRLAERIINDTRDDVAGLTKLDDLKGFRTIVSDFGLPAWLAGPLASKLQIAYHFYIKNSDSF